MKKDAAQRIKEAQAGLDEVKKALEQFKSTLAQKKQTGESLSQELTDKEKIVAEMEKEAAELSAKLEPMSKKAQQLRQYFLLLSIECEEKQDNRQGATAGQAGEQGSSATDEQKAGEQKTDEQKTDEQKTAEQKADEQKADEAAASDKTKAAQPVVYRIIFQEVKKILPGMFRMGITMRWQDVLEYIVTPGEYRKSFPHLGSVVGLALLARQTIVMDRDQYKKFRTASYPDGLCPHDIEQLRGLDEIDFLSYISVPVVSRISNPEEVSLGVVNIDSKLFAARLEEFNYEVIDEEKGIYSARVVREKLTQYASKLYDQDDNAVKYLEEMRAVIVPILELYLKCRQGAS